MCLSFRMALWSFIFLALVASSVLAEELATFPEVIRERSGSRIVSGWEAVEGQFPYQLSLRMVTAVGGVGGCGATIIHSEWGLTAAHCTAGRHTFIIRAGAVNLTRPEVVFETREFYNHPLYNNNLPSVVQPHDIGLLKFGRSLTFSDRIQPVRIQASRDKNRNYHDVVLVATGWGALWTGQAGPENMNWVYLRGTSNEFCRQQYGGSSIIAESTLCARYYNVTSQSTCSGDSGGGLTVVDDDGKISQVGVSSFVSGLGCHVVIPAGFIIPGHYHDWYTEVTGIDFDWELEEGSGSDESGPDESGPDESGPDESGSDESGPDESGPDESGPDESGPDESGSEESGPDESGPDESGPDDSGSVESGSDESGSDESGSDESGSDESGSDESGSDENESTSVVSPVQFVDNEDQENYFKLFIHRFW